MVVTLHEGSLFVAFLFGEGFDVFVADSIERFHAPVFVGASGLGDSVGFVVAFSVDVGAESFVVDFVAVFAFNGGSGCFSEFELSLALHFDSLVGCLEGCKQVGF